MMETAAFKLHSSGSQLPAEEPVARAGFPRERTGVGNPPAALSHNGFSSRIATTAKKPNSISHQGNENNKVATDWDSYLSAISGNIVEIKAARTIAQQDYERALAEADAWSRRLEIAALNNSNEDTVRQSLLRQTDCKDRAHQLKVVIEKYGVQISTLESQLAMWGQQISRDV